MWGRVLTLSCLFALGACFRPYGEAGGEEGSAQDSPQSSPATRTTTSGGDAGAAPIPAPTPTDAGTVIVNPGALPPRAPTDVVWTGTMGKMVAPFGGSPYCQYTVTFDEVRVTMTVDPSGRTKSAEVRAKFSETTTTDCPNGTIPTHEQTYLHLPSDAGAGSLALVGLASNEPRAMGSLTIGDENDDALTVTLRIGRIDQPAPLDWTVTGEATLTRPQP